VVSTTNPVEKYARQNRNLPQVGEEIKKHLKPPLAVVSSNHHTVDASEIR